MNSSIHLPYDQQPQPYHSEIARLVAQYAPDKASSVLDIGCGVGHCLSEINRLSPTFNFSVADIDPHCIELTSKRVNLEQQYLIQDISDLFHEETIKPHVIIMSHSLEHMVCPHDVVKSVMQLLKPGGILVLAVPNVVRFPIMFNNLLRTHSVNRGHIYAWDRSHWVNFLENILELNVISYGEDYVPLPRCRNIKFVRPFEIWLKKVFPLFSFSNIAVIKKAD